MCDSHRAGEGQAPVMSWAVWSIYQRTKDKEWLHRIYPTLRGYVNFWSKYHSSDRGLCKYFNAGQIGDNDARFDPIMKGEGNQPLYGFESPDLNSFLVMEMKCLSALAKELNLSKEAKEWNDKAAQLSQKIIDAMYFPDEAMFYDVKERTKENFSGVKSPNMFLPLWAGVPLPQKEIKRIINDHMLNPNEFYRKYPFPSLAYNNPEYDPTGYWRGRIWPHVVYWMIQTLWKHGYHKQAEEVADSMLDMFLASPWIAENYESKGGAMIGVPEYNWSQSMVIELLLQRYKEPLP
jgi:putative isomerase